ncbi:CpaE-like family protein [Mycobacterium sp. M1]|uniref:CpaE-like family protein n=1 Tax=Mycolicibacter acidiphilus TaxID=2835306 RepID=A0ABS5RNF8_9MYCO|nr:septum site-determining protein Ssd [Mycolicibacter acidiphilus]MBS9535835.1 CpaE-like family protein [Mycolicibacter acidiphilus]
MSPPAAVLAIVTEPVLRTELDRVAAAVGVRVIHLGDGPLSRKAWSAAAAVVLDETAAGRCRHDCLPRRGRVILLAGGAPTQFTWQSAVEVGAQRVLTLPAQGNELLGELAEAGDAARDDTPRGDVLAVIGGRGGAGASVLATALAQTAGRTGPALLLDLDPFSGGIDLLAGTEDATGLRWSDLTLRGGRLDWSAVRAALPRNREVSVLSGTRAGYEMDAPTVEAVIDAGRRGGATVICDLPRTPVEPVETVLDGADLVVLVCPCDVRACAAGAAITPRLRVGNPNVGLVVRGPAPGGLRAAEVAEIVGLPLLATLRAEPRLAHRLEHGGLRLHRRSALGAAAARILGVLPARRFADGGRAAA